MPLVASLFATIPSRAETPEAHDCRAAAAYKQDGGVTYEDLQAATAIAACERATAKAPGDLTLQAYYSRALRKGEQYAAALRAATQSADGGNPAGQTMLGNMYEFGEGVSKDLVQASQWYRNGAEQGYSTAQLNLGTLYENGEGVPLNETEAVVWFRRAAEQKLPAAEFNLGWAYQYGRGVEKNGPEAARWYQLATDQGYMLAQIQLAYMFCYYVNY